MSHQCHEGAPCRGPRRRQKILRLSAAFGPQDASGRTSLPGGAQRRRRALPRQPPDGRSYALMDSPRRKDGEDPSGKGRKAHPEARPEASNPSRLAYSGLQPLGSLRQGEAQIRINQASPRLQGNVNRSISGHG